MILNKLTCGKYKGYDSFAVLDFDPHYVKVMYDFGVIGKRDPTEEDIEDPIREFERRNGGKDGFKDYMDMTASPDFMDIGGFD